MNLKTQIVQKGARFLKRKIDRVLVPEYLGNKYICPLCETNLAYFLPLPFYYLRQMHENMYIHSIFQGETSNLEHYSCPSCASSDRDRLYCLYIKKFLETAQEKNFDLLEIAPAPQLSRFLKQQPQIKHRSADLFMPGVDDRVDITDMNLYRDGQFDVFICSHVLEHIEDDRQAMRELYRILKPGGWGIAMVPILLNLTEDYENAEVTTGEDRWKHFGQDDHLRIYSKNGFVEKLADAGFQVNQFGADYFGREEFEKYGIHFRSVLYIVSKK